MENKITLKDFLVYFLTGFYCSILFLIYKRSEINFSEITKFYEHFKDDSIFITLLIIPIVYLIGQIIHSLDYIIFKLTMKLWQVNSRNRIFNVIKITFSKIHVDGIVKINNENSNEFWLSINKIQITNNYAHIEYWLLMNDLFKGILQVCVIFSIFCLINFDLTYFLLLLSLTIIFYYRANLMADKFYINSKNILSIINNNEL